MEFNAEKLRSQLARLKPLSRNASLEFTRKRQNMLGEMMAAGRQDQVNMRLHSFEKLRGLWITPKDERRSGVILYLHGGGYVTGGVEYAKGFGSTLAYECGCRVFCCAYRLAPEHPYPAALEDALEAYRYLLGKGYQNITLCGESAGGGLCYALTLKLKEMSLPMPCAIVAISPWVDLTASGASYEENKQIDPTLYIELIRYYAGCYVRDFEDPFVSPMFGDLTGMPPSLIFAGSDELLRSDAEQMHQKLREQGSISHLQITPGRWHGYLLYPLQGNDKDFRLMGKFLNRYMGQENKLRWIRLDNAAKIYPAARRHNWSNVFRLSATLKEDIDVAVMQSALDVTVRRFPFIAARLRRGMFWYYLQQLSSAPKIQPEYSYPLARMNSKEARQCAFRVIVYKNRVAVEFFHSLTDGNGGMVFLKTLLAQYLQEKYGLSIPAEQGVLGRLEEPSGAEMEDSFQKYAGAVTTSRKDSDAWRFWGTPERGNRLNVTCFKMDVKELLEKAHEYGVTMTVFLSAALMQTLLELQEEKEPDVRHRKPIKLQIPVNLRPLFPSKSLRNFALYTTPEIEPRLGHYTFREICDVVTHKFGMEVNAKQMSKLIATNVNAEKIMAVRLLPLPVKNLAMKMVFNAVGERKSCMSLSNLGQVRMPEEMEEYVQRLDFILGVQATAPYNCGVVSYKDTLYMNFIRDIQEPELEYRFYQVMQRLGISVRVDSNQPPSV